MAELTSEENAIVELARSIDALPELCILVDYEQDVGRVQEYWKPSIYSLMLFQSGRRFEKKSRPMEAP